MTIPSLFIRCTRPLLLFSFTVVVGTIRVNPGLTELVFVLRGEKYLSFAHELKSKRLKVIMTFIKLSILVILVFSCSSLKVNYYSSELKSELLISKTVLVPHIYNLPMRESIQNYKFEKFDRAIDIGAGSGILSYLLATKGFKKVISTDINPKAIETIAYNKKKLGFDSIIQERLVEKENDPYSSIQHRVDAIISNPPWFDRVPKGLEELAWYDLKYSLLRNIIKGLSRNLNPGGVALIELGGKGAIDICKELLIKENLKFKILYASDYGVFNKPYKIFEVRVE